MQIGVRKHLSVRTGCFKQSVALAAGLLLSLISHGQTLGQALEQAWLRQPQAVALSAREDEVRARADWAGGVTPSPPSLSLSNVSDRFNANAGSNAWELELAVPLWLPGQSATRVLEAKLGADELATRMQALRLELAGELREAWWALRRARLAAELAQWREAAARTLESDVLRRFKAGELARIDANLAQNERLAAENERLETAFAVRQAELSYQMLTGSAAPKLLSEELDVPQPAATAPHPQLAAAQTLAELAQARLNVVQNSRREAPELALRLQRERSDFSSPYTQTLGIKLTLPLSSGARIRQDSSAAQAEVAQAQAERTKLQQRIELDQARARADLELAQQQLVTAQQRLALTSDTLQLAEKSFSLGESDLSGLLRSRLAAFEAQALVNRQQVGQLAAVSRLNQSLGVLP